MRALWTLCFALGVFSLTVHCQDEEPPDLSDGSASVTEEIEEQEGGADQEVATDESGEAEEAPESIFVDEHVTSDQLTHLHFKMDENKDGKISKSEILDFSKATKLSQRDVLVEGAFQQIDEDADGRVSLSEHLASVVGHPVPDDVEMPKDDLSDEDAKQLEKDKSVEAAKFKVADKDGDGFLSTVELQVMLHPLVHPEIMHIVASSTFEGMDKDGDGVLTSDELSDYAPHSFSEDGEEDERSKGDFAKLDLDGNGKLNLAELKPWVSEEFHTAEAVHELFQLADEDKDEHITPGELQNARLHLGNTQIVDHFADWAMHHEL